MNVKELQAALEILSKADAPGTPEERWREAVSKVADHTAQRFKVSVNEVAMLVKTNDGMGLRFIFPQQLAMGANTFPLKIWSVAGEVVKNANGMVENQFAMTRHLSFYENVKLDAPKSGAIQKMVAAPLRVAGKAYGVIEVSRKGESVANSGPDFTKQDLTMLTEIADSISTQLQTLRPKVL